MATALTQNKETEVRLDAQTQRANRRAMPGLKTLPLTGTQASQQNAARWWQPLCAEERKHHHTIYAMGHICIKARLRQIAKSLKLGRLASFPGHCGFYAG